MTVRNPPSYLQQGSHPAVNDRLLTAGLLQRPGPCGPGQMLVTQNSSLGMSVLIAAGGCFVKGTDIANQGIYHVFNDAPVLLAVQNPDPSFPRIDAVYARVQDADASGAVNLASLAVATGSANSSPVVPVLASDTYLLATIAVPKASDLPLNQITNSLITNFNQYAMGPGSVLSGLTEAQLATYTPQYAGMYADGSDTGRLLRSNGSTFAVAADPASWTGGNAYTPVWSGEGGGAVSLGTGGTLVGQYKQVGKNVLGSASMLIGASATGPSGIYNWTLPVAARLPLGSSVDVPIGTAYYFGGTLIVGGVFARYGSAGARMALWFHGLAAQAQSGNPSGWGSGVRMSLKFAYEAA